MPCRNRRINVQKLVMEIWWQSSDLLCWIYVSDWGLFAVFCLSRTISEPVGMTGKFCWPDCLRKAKEKDLKSVASKTCVIDD